MHRRGSAPGEGADLLAQVKTLAYESDPFGCDGNDIPHGLGFGEDSTFDQLFMNCLISLIVIIHSAFKIWSYM